MQLHARAGDDEIATAEAILQHLLTKLPDWFSAMASQDVREYRAILARGAKLKKARRDWRWRVSVDTLAKDFEKLRASIFKRSGK